MPGRSVPRGTASTLLRRLRRRGRGSAVGTEDGGQPVRVVIATRIYHPEPAAASFRLRALAEGLRAEGAEVEVLTTSYRGTPGDAADIPGTAVRRWPVLRDRSGYVRGYLQYLSFDVPLVIRLLLGRRADAVVSEPPPTTGAVVRLTSMLRRTPYVYYAADIWADAAASTGAPGAVVSALRAVERWVMRGAAKVIAISQPVAERLEQLGVHDAVVVRNGIDTRTFSPDGPACGQGRFFLYSGTMSEWQGAEVFVEALEIVHRQVADVRLVYVGQGSAWDEISELSRSLPRGTVEMVPTVPPDVAAQWQRGAVASLVSIKPDQGYDFAYPTKIYAALASGTPVLYAGPGGAASDDIDQNRLGRAVGYAAEEVAGAMLSFLSGTGEQFDASRLAGWARSHVSSERSGRLAAQEVISVVTATT
jgi:glycosyltransferase involved in cell wall biosynthesis